MNPWLRVPYAIAGGAAEWISAVTTTTRPSKLARTLAARRHLLPQYEQWGATHRDMTRPLLWIHASSVGEGLMALPLVQRIRREMPAVQIAYTFFSPSGESLIPRMHADFTAYLPFDTTRAAECTLNALRPTALVFSKLDVWPILVERAHQRGIRLGLISASMPARSWRRGIGATLTHHAYGAIDGIGAVSETDARHLIEAGALASHVLVTGDTRYDQARERAHTKNEHDTLIDSLRGNRLTVVAGSTWATDEARLLPAWERVISRVPGARLVIAPHEIHDTHIRNIESWARLTGMRCAHIGSTEAPVADVIVIDRIGVLADLYTIADLAYVGGGFHAAGLHSVVEPAVYGAPVIIGPRHHDSRDARLLLDAGGAASAEDTTTLADLIQRLLVSPADRQHMATALQSVVSRELGATTRSFGIIRELLRTV